MTQHDGLTRGEGMDAIKGKRRRVRTSERSGRLHVLISADAHSDLLEYSREIDEPMAEIATEFIRQGLAQRAQAS